MTPAALPRFALLLWIGGLAVSCGGGKEEPAKPSPTPAASARDDDADFRRHLRLATEQIRRHLGESARAELERCASIRPDDPELRFHRARAILLEDGRPIEEASALLDRVIAASPDHVRARRLRFSLAILESDRARAEREQREIERILGALGTLEMASFRELLAGGRNLQFGRPAPGAEHRDYHRAMIAGFRKLRRAGDYDPGVAVPGLVELFRRFPDLSAARYFFAKFLLSGEVRVADNAGRDDLPPMSSKVILDLAQLELERVLDQIDPGSLLALDVIRELASVAMQMGDYDDAVFQAEIVLGWPGLPDALRHEALGVRGLARYKQDRHDEAIRDFRASLEGDARAFRGELAHRWLLHLAHEAAGTPPSEREASFRLREDLACEPSKTLRFRDVAGELGIDKLDGLGPSAWADYDGDGDYDLYVSGGDAYGALYRNDGDRFTDVSREAGLFHTQSGYSATFADVDEDGDPDLYIGRDGWNGPARNSLYRNDGGRFTEVTAQAGLADPGSSFVHAWSDVDRDGDLDLYVANGITGSGDTNRLYRNDGKERFTDATDPAGLAEPPGTRTIGLAFGDYDDDGWPDLFVSGHEGPNRLYRNRGDGTFENVTARAGVEGRDAIGSGYVAFFLDHDADGDLDILRTMLAPWNDVLLALSDRFAGASVSRRAELLSHCPRLYRNDGDGTFTDVTVAAGLVHPIGIMGAGVADLDNDGFLDLYFGTGDPKIGRMEPDRFYRNDGDGSFTDLTFATGLGNVGKGHGITFVDLDGDGDLEIYAPEGGFVHGDPWRNAFYRNEQSTGNHWLLVDLVATRSNRDAIGTRVTVVAGGRRILREKGNGEGFGSSNAPTLHFGLGRAASIDRVEVRWPSGAVQRLEDIRPDTRITVREPDASASDSGPPGGGPSGGGRAGRDG